MNPNTKLIRNSDGKVFQPIYLGHWSEIKAKDGDYDVVKWLQGSEYVSMNKGASYTKLASEE